MSFLSDQNPGSRAVNYSWVFLLLILNSFCCVASDNQSFNRLLDWIEADAPDLPPKVVEPRHRDREYSVAHVKITEEDKLYILTNADGAEDFKIVEVPLAATGKANWTDVIAHQAGRLIRSLVELPAADSPPWLTAWLSEEAQDG